MPFLFGMGTLAIIGRDFVFFVLFALWVILNGRWTTEIALFGVGIAGLLYAFCWAFLGFSPQVERRLAQKAAAGIHYVALLIKEIVKCNLKLIRIVYSHSPEVAPKLITFETPLRGVKKTILANSITLTPGTITVEDEPNSGLMTVHCLNEDMADGIENCVFQQSLCRDADGEAQK